MKHSFIFLNPSSKESKILGLFLNNKCGYEADKSAIFEASSIGGPKNSESKFGIYELGTVIKEESYGNRSGYHYSRLENDGWKGLGRDAVLEEDLKDIKYID